MKRYYLKTEIYTLLTLLVFAVSCNGQVKTDLPADSFIKPKTVAIEQPKLITKHRTYQDEKLSHNIYCSLLDKAGNLWFGTTGDGVYRFDGKFFINFNTKDGLNGDGVYSILEDKAGNIWFGTNAGICRYDGTTITNVPIMTSNNVSLSGGVMLQDRSGIIWFSTSKGVYCYNGKSFTNFLENVSVINNDGLNLKNVQRILEDKKGNIWFCSGMDGGEGVCRYDGKFITSFKPNGDVWVPYVLEDKKGNIWFSGRSHGYFRYDGKNFTDFTEKVGFSSVLEDIAGNICLSGKVGFGPILEDKAGNIWFTGKMIRFGGEGGIWRYDGKSCTNFTTKDGLGDYGIWSMVEDKSGNIWIGTNNTGLYRFDGKTFSCFSE